MAVEIMSLDNYHLELMRQNVTMIRQINASINTSYKPIEKQKTSLFSKTNISTISETGKQFSTYYQDIKKSENEGALNGLKKVALEMSKDSNEGNFLSLNDQLSDIKSSDYNQYINFFETADTLDDRYHRLGDWLNTFTEIEDSNQQSQFIDFSKDFMSKEGPQHEVNGTFSDFLKKINEINHTNVSEDIKQEQINQLFDNEKITLTEASPLNDA